MYEISRAAVRKLKQLQGQPLLDYMTRLINPLTTEQCTTMEYTSASLVQMLLLDLATHPEYFEGASRLLAKTYADDPDKDSDEAAYKNSFAKVSDIPDDMKNKIFIELINSSHSTAVALAFNILETLLPSEGDDTREYLLAAVLQAMQNPAKTPNLMSKVQVLIMLFFDQLSTTKARDKIIIQLARSAELLLFSDDILDKILIKTSQTPLQWTPVALDIFKETIPLLSQIDLNKLLSKIAGMLLSKYPNADQKPLFEVLTGEEFSTEVSTWAGFNLDHVTPPHSPNRITIQPSSPVAPRWEHSINQWKQTAVSFRATYDNHPLEFNEIIDSYKAFSSFVALGISFDEVNKKIAELELLVSEKHRIYTEKKAEIQGSNVNDSADATQALEALGQEFLAQFNKLKIYRIYSETFSACNYCGNAQALVEYAKFENIKTCIWQRNDKGLIVHSKSHDNPLDPDTKHFILTDKYLNLLHRNEIRQQLQQQVAVDTTTVFKN